eukprot:478364-Ditylum_brightwellii.AAC.1
MVANCRTNVVFKEKDDWVLVDYTEEYDYVPVFDLNFQGFNDNQMAMKFGVHRQQQGPTVYQD